jgi:hypothetical protein
MSSPSTIIIPGIVSHLERFLRPLAATSGDGVEIRQDDFGTTVSVCEGRHAATITTRPAGQLEPVLVDPAALAGVDPSQPVKLYRLSPTSGAVVQASGELATVTITPGTLQRSARDLADVVEGEIASGTTRAVFELDPRHLLAAPEAIVATGAETMTVAVAPRWNVLACMAETADVSAAFLVAGETFEQPAAGQTGDADDGDPLAFTIGERKQPARRPPGARARVPQADHPSPGIPW